MCDIVDFFTLPPPPPIKGGGFKKPLPPNTKSVKVRVSFSDNQATPTDIGGQGGRVMSNEVGAEVKRCFSEAQEFFAEKYSDRSVQKPMNTGDEGPIPGLDSSPYPSDFNLPFHLSYLSDRQKKKDGERCQN